MTGAGLDVFDRTVQKSNRWLKALQEELRWEDRHDTYLAFRSVMHALRDRLPEEEAADLASQLPMLLSGVYYHGWRPGAVPAKIRDRDEFLARIREEFEGTALNPDAERITRAVFRLLDERISEGEIEDVLRVLPGEIRGLWPEAERVDA